MMKRKYTEEKVQARKICEACLLLKKRPKRHDNKKHTCMPYRTHRRRNSSNAHNSRSQSEDSIKVIDRATFIKLSISHRYSFLQIITQPNTRFTIDPKKEDVQTTLLFKFSISNASITSLLPIMPLKRS